MDIKIFSSDRRNDWDSFVSDHKDGSIFHTMRWKRVLDKSNLGISSYMIMEDKNKIVGVCPLYITNVFPFLRVFTLPSSDYANPLLAKVSPSQIKEALSILFSKAASMANEYKVSFWKLYLPMSSELNRFMPNRFTVEREYGSLILELDENAERMFVGKIHKKTRTSIRKAIKMGLEVTEELPNVNDFYDLYLSTMRRNKGFPEDITQLKVIWEELLFKKDFTVLTAKFNGKMIAVILAFLFKNKAYVWKNSSLPTCLWLNPNEFLYWKLIEQLISRGFKYLDFGPTPLNPSAGHHFFKSRFGGRMVPLCEYYVPYSKIDLSIYRNMMTMGKLLNVRKKLPDAMLTRFQKRLI